MGEISGVFGLTVDVFHNAAHLAVMRPHIGGQPDLGPGADQIVGGIGGFEIQVAVQIILQEPHGHLHRHIQRAQRQQLHFLGRQRGGAGAARALPRP